MLTITTDGTTGKQWIKRLEKGGYTVGDYAKELLSSKAFKPTKGKVFNLAILKASEVGEWPTTDQLKAEAKNRGWDMPTPEMACYLREKLSDKEMEKMGLWYVACLHEPISLHGYPGVVALSRSGDGQRVNAYYGRPTDRWDQESGVAFPVPQGSQPSEPESSDLQSLALRIAKLESLVNPKLLK